MQFNLVSLSLTLSAIFQLARPRFIIKPENTLVKQAAEVRLKCFSIGNPSPSVFWMRDLNSPLASLSDVETLESQLTNHILFAGKSAGKMSVTKENTLILRNVQKEDEG